MEDVVFKYSNETAFFNRLVALGLSVNAGTNPETGAEYRAEELLGLCSTPVLEDISGDKYMTARMSSEDADKLPNNNQNPAFAIIWRSSEFDYNDPDFPIPFPWPEAEVEVYDIDGNYAGTMMEAIGKIV